MFESLSKRLHRDSGLLSLSIAKRDLSIRLGAGLADRAGFKIGQKLDLLIGTDDDAGLVQIAPVNADRGALGWKTSADREGRAAIRLRLPAIHRGSPVIPGMPLRLVPSPLECEFVDIEGQRAIQFRLPWCNGEPEPVSVVAAERHELGTEPAAIPPRPFLEPEPETEQRWPLPISTGANPDAVVVPAEPVAKPGPISEIPGHVLNDCGPVDVAPVAEPVPAAKPAEPEPLPSRFNPDNWPADVRERFIDAAARGKMAKDLADICGRPIGSIYNIRQKLAREIGARRREIDRERLVRAPRFPEGVSKTEPAPKPAEPEEPADPPIPASVFLYLTRQRVMQRLQAAGYVATQNREKTKLILDGKAMTPETFIRETNKILELSGSDALRLP